MNSTIKSTRANDGWTFASVLSPGCQSIIISESSNIPSLIIQSFPKNFSSAGVPKNLTVPVKAPFSINSFIAIAAPKLAVPKRLCPHPWPAPPATNSFLYGTDVWDRPGKASNSPIIPITGFPSPYVAVKAVGIPAKPFSTFNPFSSAYCIKNSADFSSLNATSAASHILLLTDIKADDFCSREFNNSFFNLFTLWEWSVKAERVNNKIGRTFFISCYLIVC